MSGPSKRPRLLQPSEISELIVDTDSDEARVSSDISSLEGNISSVEGGSESEPGLSQPQPYRQTASCHESSVTQRYPSEEYVGTCWTRTESTKAH